MAGMLMTHFIQSLLLTKSKLPLIMSNPSQMTRLLTVLSPSQMPKPSQMTRNQVRPISIHTMMNCENHVYVGALEYENLLPSWCMMS